MSAQEHRKETVEKQIEISSNLATPVLKADKRQNAFIRIALSGYELESEIEKTPLNVAIVLDQSSSMSGEKIYQAKHAAWMAINQLDENDIVSIVTYDSKVRVLVPATLARDKHYLNQKINEIRARGKTALYAGTKQGANEVKKFLNNVQVNRVVLLSDGQANVGPSSSYDLGLLGADLASNGISVSTIGLGLNYNEDLMTQLAVYSDGNHYFVEHADELASIFKKEFGLAQTILAQNIDININLAEGVMPIRILGRQGNIKGNKVSTSINQIYAEQEGHVILEVSIPANLSNSTQNIANITVDYDHMQENKRLTLNDLVTATFSDSAEEIQESVHKPSYEAAIRQVANENRKRAVELRDQGKRDEASSLIVSSSSLLSEAADYISSDALRHESVESQKEIESIQSQNDHEWNRARKELKLQTYQLDKQQQ